MVVKTSCFCKNRILQSVLLDFNIEGFLMTQYCVYTYVVSNSMERREQILNWLISGMQQAPNSLTEMFYFDKKEN